MSRRIARAAIGCVLSMAALSACAALPPGIVDLPTETPTHGGHPTSTARPPILLAHGRFVSDAEKTDGSVRLVLRPDGSHVIALVDFSTAGEGDLSVVVSDASEPETAAPDGVHTVSLGPLKARSGDQSYGLPSGLNVDNAASVVIWNESSASANGAATLIPRG